MSKSIDPATRERIKKNLFPGASSAVEPLEDFPWHRGGRGIDTDKAHSSQALAIDLFGTLKYFDGCDEVLDAVAKTVGIPGGVPWRLELEWPTTRILDEITPSQIDAMAIGKHSVIFFECKFTEKGGGSCSQVQPLLRGKHRGAKQCNGDYVMQVNPVKRVRARCALAGKGIRYWEVIPEVFDLERDRDHTPCPFSGPWFQWMRNLVLCKKVASAKDLRPATIVIFADGAEFAMAEHVRSADWASLRRLVRKESIAFDAISYQRFLAVGSAALLGSAQRRETWNELTEWIMLKISRHVAV